MIEEMISSNLAQYGTLGLFLIFTIYLYFRNEKREDNLFKTNTEALQNNTIAMTKIYEIMQNCKK